MDVIEIRADQRKHKLNLTIIGSTVFVSILYPYFSGFFGQPKYKSTQWMIILFAAFMVLGLIRSFIWLKKGRPILILSREGIEINDSKPQFFAWSWIDSWRIEKDDNANYLFIESGATKKKVMIDMLEIKAEEMENLIHEYSVPKKEQTITIND